jgi:antitoxin CptB
MDPEIGKLRWRCRRGMKELDVLLTRYVDEQYRNATPDHQEAFRQLLDAQDPQLFAYFLGRELPADAVLSSLLIRITAGTVTAENGAVRGC